MARLYADEHFPRIVSQLLRNMGHDVGIRRRSRKRYCLRSLLS